MDGSTDLKLAANATDARGTPQGSTSPTVVRAAIPFVLLAAIAGIGQVAANLPLATIPSIGRSFGLDAAGAGLVVAAYLAVVAPAQLVWGPLSDRHGRRPVVLIALGIFAVGSALAALAPAFWVLLVGRGLQAVGGAAGMVAARASLRDVSADTSGTGRRMSSLSLATAAVPALAPLLGAWLESLGGWRLGFWVTAATALAVLAASWRRMEETNHRRLARLDPRAVWQGYGIVARSSGFLAHAAIAAGAMGGLFGFGAGSPGLYIEQFGLAPSVYAIYPLVAVLGSMLGGVAALLLMKRKRVAAALGIGVALMVVGGVGMALLQPLGLFGKHSVNVTMLTFVIGLGLALPAAFAEALANQAERAGTAASLAAAIQIAGGAVAAASVAVVPMPLVMGVCGLVTLVALLGRGRAPKRS